MILKNENDIYMYFETIEQLAPQRVLDIGMFLKRIGSVSRKVMDREVPAEVCLDGIDLFPQFQFPVWRNQGKSGMILPFFWEWMRLFWSCRFLSWQRNFRSAPGIFWWTGFHRYGVNVGTMRWPEILS